MADVRTLVGAFLLICAVVIAYLGIVYNGYQEDAGETPARTLWWAIPWTVATVGLGVLVLGAIFHRMRRARWSWLALGLALVMAILLVALFAIE